MTATGKTKYKPRYTVRKQSSGYTHSVKWFVFDTNPKTGGRVTVHAHLMRDAAQAEADSLNILEMTVPAAEDERPFEVRRAEAAERYEVAKVGEGMPAKAGKPIIDIL